MLDRKDVRGMIIVYRKLGQIVAHMVRWFDKQEM